MQSHPIQNHYRATNEDTAKRMLDFAFKQIPPKVAFRPALLPWQILYQMHPDMFLTNGEAHQDNMADPMHISVIVDAPAPFPKARFHINGYMRSNKFIMVELQSIHQDGKRLVCEYDNVYDHNNPKFNQAKDDRSVSSSRS